MKRRSALTIRDFMTADIALTQNQFVEIGKFVIGAGRYITPGWGYLSSQADADGRIFFHPETTAQADISGTLLISLYTPEDRHYADLFEDRTENLYTNIADRTKQLPFPEMVDAGGSGKDWIIKLFFKSDTAAISIRTQANWLCRLRSKRPTNICTIE
jgi:hypothetical protein